MRKRTVAVALLAVTILGCQFGDQLTARLEGSPVHLVAASGSLEPLAGSNKELPRFTHAFLHRDSLRFVVRTDFYNSGPLAQPYLSVDDEGHGVIHIAIKPQLKLFSTKCQFIRQFEVEVAPEQWRQLKTLRLFNHDTEEPVTEVMPLSDPQYLSKLLHESQQQVAFEGLQGFGHGC